MGSQLKAAWICQVTICCWKLKYISYWAKQHGDVKITKHYWFDWKQLLTRRPADVKIRKRYLLLQQLLSMTRQPGDVEIMNYLYNNNELLTAEIALLN